MTYHNDETARIYQRNEASQRHPAVTDNTYNLLALSAGDTGTGDWSTAGWAEELFKEEPALVALSELHTEGGGFHFDFVVSAKLPTGQVRHHLLEWMSFFPEGIASLVHNLYEKYEDGGFIGTYWLEEFPTRRKLRGSLTRSRLGLAESTPAAPLTEAERDEEFGKVMDEHGNWMIAAFQLYPTFTLFGKRKNVKVSPNTFLIERCSSTGDVVHTYMKYPDLDKIKQRLKFERNRWKRSTGNEMDDLGLIFTRERVFAYYGKDKSLQSKPTAESEAAVREERIAAGYERRTAKGDEEMKKGNCCTECGVSFVTNLQFGRGEEKFCGDCEANHDEANGQRQVHLEFVFQRRRLLVPKRNTRFDPRPGIDDVGLGGSGPNWED